MSKKKIIYICPNGFLGGAERFVLNASKGHLDYGQWEPTILFFSHGEAVLKAQNENIETYVLKTNFRLLNPFKTILAAIEIRKFLKKEKPDYLHATMAYGYIMTWFSSIFLSYKRLWFQHGPVNNVLDLIANQLPVNHMAFNSSYLKDLHHENPRFLGKISQKEHIIHLGIPDSLVSPEKVNSLKTLLKPNHQFLIMSAGRITQCKGYETIIKAVHLLEKNENFNSSNLKLIIVGSPTGKDDNKYQTSLMNLVKKYSIEDLVDFIPFQPHINEYYAVADCFIQASTVPEPFGLTAAEAMKQSTFTIGCKTGGIVEILKNEETGRSFNSSSSEAHIELAQILNTIIKNDEYRQKISIAGKQIVDKKLSIKDMIHHLEQIYSS